MTCEELRPEYCAYALGVSENPERAGIGEHLARQCPECTAGVRSAVATVAAMAGAVADSKPPAILRKRVLAMVAPDYGRRGVMTWFPWGLAAALAIVLMSVALSGRLQKKPDTTTLAASKLEKALSILNDPDTRDVSFGDPKARGRVFISPDKGVVFIAAHLPALDHDRTFEMWVIPTKGNPIPAGTFAGETDATAVHLRPGPVADVAAIAVTVEPAGGSLQPTTTPFIVTKL